MVRVPAAYTYVSVVVVVVIVVVLYFLRLFVNLFVCFMLLAERFLLAYFPASVQVGGLVPA